MLNTIKKLVKQYPNDADLGSAIRQYVSDNKTCCDNKENHITENNSYTTLMEDNLEIHCKVCGKFLGYA